VLVGVLILAGCDTAVDSDPADPADGQVTAPTSKQTSQSSVEEFALHIQRASTDEEAARAPFRCYIRMRSTANWDSRQLSAWEAGPSAVEQSTADVQRLSDASFQYDTIILHPSDTWLQSVRASGESLNAVQLRYQLRSPDGTVLREAYCRVPDQADVKRQIVAQLAWSTQAHVSPSYATIEQENTACDDADVCITETARTTDVGSALYVPQSCDGPGGGGGDGGSGGGGGGGAGDWPGDWPPDDGDGGDGGSDWPDDPWPDDPPESPDPPEDPPEEDPPEEDPPSDPDPPDDGGDGCEEIDPSEDCILAVNPSQSVFGIATQSCCIRCPDEGDDPTPWALAKNIGGKMLRAVGRGEDLLDARTWKNMIESEWAEAAQAGLDTQAALNGDVVALVSVLDYIAGQVVGVGFFDMLQGLKLADRLGLSWYDDVIGAMHSSQHFPRLAQHMGDFANTIGDLDVLEDVARLNVGDFNVPQILSASSTDIANNFLRKWGDPTKTPIPDKPPGSWTATAPDGTVLTRYPSTTGDPGRWTLQFRRPDGSIVKIRFGE